MAKEKKTCKTSVWNQYTLITCGSPAKGVDKEGKPACGRHTKEAVEARDKRASDKYNANREAASAVRIQAAYSSVARDVGISVSELKTLLLQRVTGYSI